MSPGVRASIREQIQATIARARTLNPNAPIRVQLQDQNGNVFHSEDVPRGSGMLDRAEYSVAENDGDLRYRKPSVSTKIRAKIRKPTMATEATKTTTPAIEMGMPMPTMSFSAVCAAAAATRQADPKHTPVFSPESIR